VSTDISYTTVESLHSIQSVMFLAELNDLKLYIGEIGKMYLEVYNYVYTPVLVNLISLLI
jgi:hypothetical protein